jgi:phosphoglycolate phosphatase-like HAD superfamily hydrolase
LSVHEDSFRTVLLSWSKEIIELKKAAIFDLDGTLLDSVDLHAIAWHEAMIKFGHDVSFEQVRGQIGKGGDKLIPVFLSPREQRDHGKELEEWRGQRFKTEYLPLVRPFSAVPELLRRVREGGLHIAVASSAKRDEVQKYLDIACIEDLVDLTTSSDDAEESKPSHDVFEIVLHKLKIDGAQAVAIGDTPYDAEAAGKATIATIGLLCGGFTENSLRQAGMRRNISRAGCAIRLPRKLAPFAIYRSTSSRLRGSDVSHLRAIRQEQV